MEENLTKMTRKIQILEKILNESQRDKIDKFKEGICSLFVSDPHEEDIYSQALIELLVEYIAYVKINDKNIDLFLKAMRFAIKEEMECIND